MPISGPRPNAKGPPPINIPACTLKFLLLGTRKVSVYLSTTVVVEEVIGFKKE